MAKGGYRKPTQPAPVSGPGALSQRTDGGAAQPARYVSGLPYGEGADFLDIQSSAPMENAPAGTSQGLNAAQAASPSSPLIPLDAPSMRPNEPVTHGADAGAGGSSAILGIAPQNDETDTILRALYAVNPNENIRRLLAQLDGE